MFSESADALLSRGHVEQAHPSVAPDATQTVGVRRPGNVDHPGGIRGDFPGLADPQDDDLQLEGDDTFHIAVLLCGGDLE